MHDISLTVLEHRGHKTGVNTKKEMNESSTRAHGPPSVSTWSAIRHNVDCRGDKNQPNLAPNDSVLSSAVLSFYFEVGAVTFGSVRNSGSVSHL